MAANKVTFSKIKKLFARDKDVIEIKYSYNPDPKKCFILVQNLDDTYRRRIELGDWIYTDGTEFPHTLYANYRRVTGFTKKYVKCGKKRFRIAGNRKISSMNMHNPREGKSLNEFLDNLVNMSSKTKDIKKRTINRYHIINADHVKYIAGNLIKESSALTRVI